MDCLRDQFAPSTNSADRSHMKKWTAHCADMDTSPLRTDCVITVNLGVDLAGHQREVFLMCTVRCDEVPSHDGASQSLARGCPPCPNQL